VSPEAARPATQPNRSVPTTKGSFLVTGNHTVFGVEPGGNVDLELPTSAFDALVASGNIDPNPVVAEKSEPTQTVQAEQPVPVVIQAGDTATASDHT
jgi:hypothetical protein